MWSGDGGFKASGGGGQMDPAAFAAYWASASGWNTTRAAAQSAAAGYAAAIVPSTTALPYTGVPPPPPPPTSACAAFAHAYQLQQQLEQHQPVQQQQHQAVQQQQQHVQQQQQQVQQQYQLYQQQLQQQQLQQQQKLQLQPLFQKQQQQKEQDSALQRQQVKLQQELLKQQQQQQQQHQLELEQLQQKVKQSQRQQVQKVEMQQQQPEAKFPSFASWKAVSKQPSSDQKPSSKESVLPSVNKKTSTDQLNDNRHRRADSDITARRHELSSSRAERPPPTSAFDRFKPQMSPEKNGDTSSNTIDFRGYSQRDEKRPQFHIHALRSQRTSYGDREREDDSRRIRRTSSSSRKKDNPIVSAPNLVPIAAGKKRPWESVSHYAPPSKSGMDSGGKKSKTAFGLTDEKLLNKQQKSVRGRERESGWQSEQGATGIALQTWRPTSAATQISMSSKEHSSGSQSAWIEASRAAYRPMFDQKGPSSSTAGIVTDQPPQKKPRVDEVVTQDARSLNTASAPLAQLDIASVKALLELEEAKYAQTSSTLNLMSKLTTGQAYRRNGENNLTSEQSAVMQTIDKLVRNAVKEAGETEPKPKFSGAQRRKHKRLLEQLHQLEQTQREEHSKLLEHLRQLEQQRKQDKTVVLELEADGGSSGRAKPVLPDPSKQYSAALSQPSEGHEGENTVTKKKPCARRERRRLRREQQRIMDALQKTQGADGHGESLQVQQGLPSFRPAQSATLLSTVSSASVSYFPTSVPQQKKTAPGLAYRQGLQGAPSASAPAPVKQMFPSSTARVHSHTISPSSRTDVHQSTATSPASVYAPRGAATGVQQSRTSVSREDDDGTLKAVLILDGNHDLFLTADQAVQVQSVLIDAIDDSKANPPPRFDGCSYARGRIRLSCANQPSFDWLRSTVPTLKPWPQAKMTAILQSELVEKVSIVILIPADGQDWSYILRMISRQNPEINTSGWQLKKQEETKDVHGGRWQRISVLLTDEARRQLEETTVDGGLGEHTHVEWSLLK